MPWQEVSVKEEMKKQGEDFWDKYSKTAIPKEFIKEFADKINWRIFCKEKNLTEDFIREYKDKVDWEMVSRYQKLSEDFIREFKDKVDWESISCYQVLSEDFIREFQDKVDWDLCFLYQILSDKFIDEFNDRIYEVEDNEEGGYTIPCEVKTLSGNDVDIPYMRG